VCSVLGEGLNSPSPKMRFAPPFAVPATLIRTFIRQTPERRDNTHE
jgi:hypothetical protein